jgi:glycosyltransferase involved in cell wall biosynthesis
VQAEFSAMGQYLPPRAPTGPRTLVIFHEPGTAAAEEREKLAGEPSLFWRFEAKRWRRFERGLLQRVDAAVAFSSRDADFLLSLEPAAHVHVLPVGVRVPPPTTDALLGPPRVLFVGNFAHAPNVEAARFLVDEIQPLLRARFPALEVWVIGHGAPISLRRRTQPGISVKGYIPDLADYMARASVVVAPLRSGSGVRVKVLEAMAAGKAIVATPLAAEGIDVEPGRHLLLAHDAAEFCDAITALLNEPARRRELGRAARGLIYARHTRERAAAEYEALYDRLLAPFV